MSAAVSLELGDLSQSGERPIAVSRFARVVDIDAEPSGPARYAVDISSRGDGRRSILFSPERFALDLVREYRALFADPKDGHCSCAKKPPFVSCAFTPGEPRACCNFASSEGKPSAADKRPAKPHPRPALPIGKAVEPVEPTAAHGLQELANLLISLATLLGHIPASKTVPTAAPSWDCHDYHVDAHGDPYAAVCRAGCEHKAHKMAQAKVRTKTGAWQEHVLQGNTTLAIRDMNVSRMIGERFGTGEERTAIEETRSQSGERFFEGLVRVSERPSKAVSLLPEKERHHKPLTASASADALARIGKMPRMTRELKSATWRELVNPPADALAVDDDDIEKRVERARWRAEKNIDRESEPLWATLSFETVNPPDDYD